MFDIKLARNISRSTGFALVAGEPKNLAAFFQAISTENSNLWIVASRSNLNGFEPGGCLEHSIKASSSAKTAFSSSCFEILAKAAPNRGRGKISRLIAHSIANQSGVPNLILDHVVGVGDAVAEGVVGSCGAGDAAAGLSAGFRRCGAFDSFLGSWDIADEFWFS